MDKKNIALVIKTSGLEYDDRVRKEILTIQKLFPEITFKIFVMLPDNKETEGVTGYGVPYRSVYISAREKYSGGSKTLLKCWQFYKTIEKDLSRFDVIWLANDDTSLFALLLKNRKIVWDLHELPSELMQNRVLRLLLRFLFNRCKCIIHANPQRKLYLEEMGLIKNPMKHFSIRNYPNFDECDSIFDEKYFGFLEWKKDRKCVYLQGLNGNKRADYETISAVLSIDQLVAVVVGDFEKETYERLENRYGELFQNRIYFVGKIPQLKIPQYVKKCFTTLVFYKNVTPNNYYCEANRFYQAVILGLPVVVGNNPPMKELVNKYGFGISIDDDGSDVNKIKKGLEIVINRHSEFVQNNNRNKKYLYWNTQDGVFVEIINKLFD